MRRLLILCLLLVIAGGRSAPRADALQHNVETLRVRVEHVGARGALPAFDREFFVVSTTQKKIVAFSRSNPGTPLRIAQLKEFGRSTICRFLNYVFSASSAC